MECPHCKSNETVLAGARNYDKKRIYCKTCQKWSKMLQAPKILLFDIETSRLKASLWRKGEQYVRWQQIDETPFIISWAGKWLFDPESFGTVVTPSEAKARDDRRVVKALHRAMNKADLVITHNGDKFDIKVMNWYFIKYGLEPNNRYKSIDTLKEYKKICAPPLGYSLDALAQELGYAGKIETKMELWEGCEAGNKKALTEIFVYNKNDVFVDEDVYLRIRGWMKSHPNLAIYFDMYQELKEGEYMCPRCTETIYETKFSRVWRSPAGYAYKSCNCPHCGAVLRKTERNKMQMIGAK